MSNSSRIGGKVKSEVEKILHCFGETTVEWDVWAKLQVHGDRIGRFRLLEFQAVLGQEKESINTLLSLLRDESGNARSRAADSLAKLAKTSDTIMPEVVKLLEQNRDENVMGGAIDCLYLIVVE